MSLLINRNPVAMNNSMHLGRNLESLKQSFRRLGTGRRINQAGDDSAGLSISQRMLSQIRGLNQAARSAGDGISMMQTLDDALGTNVDLLQRMRELAVQAANDTNTFDSRVKIQKEVSALVDEFDRVAQQTLINQRALLDGYNKGFRLQVGSNETDNLSLAFQNMQTDMVGWVARLASAEDIEADSADDALFDGDVVINGVTIRATVQSDDTLSTTFRSASAISKAQAINDSTAFTGVQAIVYGSSLTGENDITAVTLDSTNYIEINGVPITGFAVHDNDAGDRLIDAINAEMGKTGVIATRGIDQKLTLYADDGRNIAVNVFGDAVRTGLLGAAGSRVVAGRLAFESRDTMELDGAELMKLGRLGDVDVRRGPPGGGGPPGQQNGGPPGQGGAPPPGIAGRDFTLLGGLSRQTSLRRVDVSFRAGANEAIKTLDVAFDEMMTARGKLGAIPNRLLSVIDTIQTNRANLSSARSLITDADFAHESTAAAKAEVMTQASAALASQANQQPEIALQLLQA